MDYVSAFWVGGIILCTGADIAGQNEDAASGRVMVLPGVP